MTNVTIRKTKVTLETSTVKDHYKAIAVAELFLNLDEAELDDLVNSYRSLNLTGWNTLNSNTNTINDEED
jgi:hypothetical protein